MTIISDDEWARLKMKMKELKATDEMIEAGQDTPTPEQFAMMIPFRDVFHLVSQGTNERDWRIAKKVRKAIDAAMDTFAAENPKTMNSHCNMALCELLFEQVCEMAPKTWTTVCPLCHYIQKDGEPEQHQSGCVHYKQPEPMPSPGPTSEHGGGN